MEDVEMEFENVRAVGVENGNHVAFFNTHEDVQKTNSLKMYGVYFYDTQEFLIEENYDEATKGQMEAITVFCRFLEHLKK